jgi:hypothetical protein
MANPCFLEKGSDPPACGIHKIALVTKYLPDDLLASGYKRFTFLACPVSGAAVDEETESPAADPNIGRLGKRGTQK